MPTRSSTSKKRARPAAVDPLEGMADLEELARRATTHGPKLDAASLQLLREKFWQALKVDPALNLPEAAAFMKMIVDARRLALAEAKVADNAAEMSEGEERAGIKTLKDDLLLGDAPPATL